MRAGPLNRRLTIFEARQKQSAMGAAQPEYVPIAGDATRWASIEPLSARELILMAQTTARITHRVRLRYVRGLTSKHQLREVDASGIPGSAGRTRIFNIVSVLDVNDRHREHEVLVLEVA